jgi:hypothetical protein
MEKNKLRKILEIESLEKSFLDRNTYQHAVDAKSQEEINNASKKNTILRENNTILRENNKEYIKLNDGYKSKQI